nr:hypothetical protein [Rhodococcus erythropolis]
MRFIHQLKYFPDGFSGDNKTTRHKQIRNSFERATKLSPPPSEWILVIPAKLTPGERTFVEGLGGPGRPAVTILDRVGLDVLIAEFPDVNRYLRRDHLRPEVELYPLETETLTGSSKPLTRRILDLGAQADSTDLFWATEFSRVGDKVTYTVRPKDTDAHKKSPITVSFDSVFGPEHDDVRRKFEQSMNFGASGAIVLPPHVVNNMVIWGPKPLPVHPAMSRSGWSHSTTTLRSASSLSFASSAPTGHSGQRTKVESRTSTTDQSATHSKSRSTST